MTDNVIARRQSQFHILTVPNPEIRAMVHVERELALHQGPELDAAFESGVHP